MLLMVSNYYNNETILLIVTEMVNNTGHKKIR